MASDSISIRPEALLRHRDFVRAIALSLVRGETAAGERSSASARSAATEEELHGHLTLQHQVVEAVLGLREPYRTIVLLRYYAGLSPKQIAARRGLSRGSVESQLERSHVLLRDRLDVACAGGREAWTAGLLALSRRTRARSVIVRLLVLAAIAAVAVLAGAFVAGWSSRTPPPTRPTAVVAHPPEPVESESSASVRSRLPSMSIPELVQIAVQVQRSLRRTVLEPSEDWRVARASLLAMPATGLARLIDRGRLGGDHDNPLGVPGGGCCYSFVNRRHGWDQEPDLVLQDGHFTSASEGAGILDLGRRRVEELEPSAEPAPQGLDATEVAAWNLFWRDSLTPAGGLDPGFLKAVGTLRLGPATPDVGHAYLVRAMQPGSHDLVVAFEPLAQDELGWTIAWRILKTWHLSARPARTEDPYGWVPAAPAWMAALGMEEAVELLASVRAAARPILLEPPAELLRRHSTLLAQPGTRITRLLAGERYRALVEERGSGSCFTFATGLHDYAELPDLRLEGEEYRTELEPRACGVLVDFGLRTLDSVGSTIEDAPEDLSPADREKWEVLWSLKPLDAGPAGRAVAIAHEDWVRRFAPERSVTAQVGHTYLLRSIQSGSHDVFVAFSTVGRDEHGDWILWRPIRIRMLR